MREWGLLMFELAEFCGLLVSLLAFQWAPSAAALPRTLVGAHRTSATHADGESKARRRRASLPFDSPWGARRSSGATWRES